MYIFQITEEDVRGTIEKSDIGKWAYLVQGCWIFFDTKEEAIASYLEVFGSN